MEDLETASEQDLKSEEVPEQTVSNDLSSGNRQGVFMMTNT